MDPSDAAQPIILFVLLLLSAFFSSSETALTTVNKLRIRTLADDDVRGAKTVIKLIEDPGRMLTAILIGNNIVNISASSIATVMATNFFDSKWVGLVIGILTFLILVFGEITPKSMATIYAEKLSLRVAGPIYFIAKLLTPIIFIMNKICNGILLLFRMDPSAKSAAITENEFRTILDFSQEEGVIESEERRMITNVVDFGDSLAKDVMVPRIDMAFANADFTYEELVQAFSEEKYTRMPVYSESRDNVIGIVNLKDVFFYNGDTKNFNILDIMREPYFTYEYKKTSELLIEMRRNSIPLAIVLDEYGATAGLITIEDLLEEIVGEIRDEYDDDEEDSIQAVSENEFIVDGNTKLDEINEGLGLNIESDDYDSIAGHIIYLLDHLPEEGETVTDKNVVFTVTAVDKNRIDKIHILLKKEDEEKVEA
ncbi:HlyC/CorC family transporter [Lachnospiraceae bacterium MD1]|uniref:HlyC/CorC family transporter n=1 Tax=Variimorphobacter saccharofermentans TaxID=2755051 RepID=A0A839JZ96_9FIRM|nr:hemolysin family protein [Variimorphobacter saccharofermentans]MBB2182537.1 HlyC/CorC family transporter [Variimorphobacter saccharofermentans]